MSKMRSLVMQQKTLSKALVSLIDPQSENPIMDARISILSVAKSIKVLCGLIEDEVHQIIKDSKHDRE